MQTSPNQHFFLLAFKGWAQTGCEQMLSVICKEQASPDRGWWRASCSLEHGHRKWADAKPRVCLRNKSLCVKEVRISSPSPTRYSKALAEQNPWPASAQGRQPCTPHVTHHLPSGSATIPCGIKASPDHSFRLWTVLGKKPRWNQGKEEIKRQGQQDLARNIGGRAFDQHGKQYKKRSEAVLLQTNQNLKGKCFQSQTTSERIALHVAPWHL